MTRAGDPPAGEAPRGGVLRLLALPVSGRSLRAGSP
jgi:hypothetical protein